MLLQLGNPEVCIQANHSNAIAKAASADEISGLPLTIYLSKKSSKER